jgi:hypothetical protein
LRRRSQKEIKCSWLLSRYCLWRIDDCWSWVGSTTCSDCSIWKKRACTLFLWLLEDCVIWVSFSNAAFHSCGSGCSGPFRSIVSPLNCSTLDRPGIPTF